MIGTRMGNWRLEAEIGRGPTGTVWRALAVDPKPDEPTTAAVKVLDPSLTRDATFRDRFPGEMLALRRLTHPNLTRFYDAGVHAGFVYYAAELAPGTDLATLLKMRDKSPAEPGLSWSASVFRIAVQTARALKHAHHRSILHRDLKPSNLILADDGTVKVTDFGVSKILSVPPLALPAEVMGSACYLPPEHFTGKPVTRKSDLYALGGVLYTLVCGRPPFVATTAAELMHRHCYMLPDRPISFVPSLPPDVDEFICSLLAKDPARRPASAAAILDDLERLRGKLERKGERVLPPPEAVDPTGLHAPLSPVTSPVATGNDRTRDRERLIRGLGIFALFVLVVAGILFAFFRPRPEAAELWQAAQPLLASDNPADWDRAREEYLDKLERWYPEAYGTELQAVRQKVQDRRELSRATKAGLTIKIDSEAERHYRRGLALAQVGDYASAQAVWTNLVRAFGDTTEDRRWVLLAEQGSQELSKLESLGRPDPPDAMSAARSLLAGAAKMREGGKKEAADAVISALRFLYADRPDILAEIKD